MIPKNLYRPQRLMASPPTLHARLEIAKAIRMIAAQEEDEHARRRAEINVIRRDLEEIPELLRKVFGEYRVLLQAELRKYSPDQPRVPAGNSDGGQWTSGSGSGSPSALSIGEPEIRSEYYPRYAMLDASSRETQTDASPIFNSESGTKPNEQLAGSLEDDEAETRIGGEVLEATFAQQERLNVAQSRFQSFRSQVRRIDPAWNPAPAMYETSVEGKIREMEVGAQEAEQYLSKLRELRLPRDPFTGELVSSPGARTGDWFIDHTTEKLQDILDDVIDKVGSRPDLDAARYGTLVHTEFAEVVRAAGLRGINADDVEKSFGVERDAVYGAKYSIRTDASLRDDDGNIIAIYDVKTGRGMSRTRAMTIRLRTGSEATVPILELYPDRDPVWKFRRA